MEDDGQADEQEELGDGQQHVDDAHQERIDPSADESGDGPVDDAENVAAAAATCPPSASSSPRT